MPGFERLSNGRLGQLTNKLKQGMEADLSAYQAQKASLEDEFNNLGEKKETSELEWTEKRTSMKTEMASISESRDNFAATRDAEKTQKTTAQDQLNVTTQRCTVTVNQEDVQNKLRNDIAACNKALGYLDKLKV